MMIEARGLVKRYGDLTAVKGLDLSVDNEIYGLLGPNGSGKTTTVNMLTTMLTITEGTASVCGYDVVRDAQKVRESISYVPQDMAVDIRLTGRENVTLFAKLYGIRDRAERKRRVEDALEVMNLADRADADGTQQRVQFGIVAQRGSSWRFPSKANMQRSNTSSRFLTTSRFSRLCSSSLRSGCGNDSSVRCMTP